jgi:hypothetical protein
MKVRYDETCQVTCEDNDKTLIADILDFKEKKLLVVSLEKSLKLTMPWNGKIYEGRLAGKSFVSPGPKGQTYKEGR